MEEKGTQKKREQVSKENVGRGNKKRPAGQRRKPAASVTGVEGILLRRERSRRLPSRLRGPRRRRRALPNRHGRRRRAFTLVAAFFGLRIVSLVLCRELGESPGTSDRVGVADSDEALSRTVSMRVATNCHYEKAHPRHTLAMCSFMKSIKS